MQGIANIISFRDTATVSVPLQRGGGRGGTGQGKGHLDGAHHPRDTITWARSGARLPRRGARRRALPSRYGLPPQHHRPDPEPCLHPARRAPLRRTYHPQSDVLGGLWGLLFAALADTLPAWPRLLLGFTFGVLGPVLASWFVVAPLKGIPIAAGWVPQRMLASILINGCWGIGLVLLYAGLRRWVAGPRQARAR
jgi:hypothetical protein